MVSTHSWLSLCHTAHYSYQPPLLMTRRAQLVPYQQSVHPRSFSWPSLSPWKSGPLQHERATSGRLHVLCVIFFTLSEPASTNHSLHKFYKLAFRTELFDCAPLNFDYADPSQSERDVLLGAMVMLWGEVPLEWKSYWDSREELRSICKHLLSRVLLGC